MISIADVVELLEKRFPAIPNSIEKIFIAMIEVFISHLISPFLTALSKINLIFNLRIKKLGFNNSEIWIMSESIDKKCKKICWNK